MVTQTKKDISWQFYLLQLPLWSALVLLVVAALLVLLIRFLVPQIDTLRPHLEDWLTASLPFEVEISHLSGSLFKIDPAIGIEKLTLSNKGVNFLVIEDVYFELDTFASLMAAAPRMKDARLAGLELSLEEVPEGWQLSGWQKKQQINTPITKNGIEASLQQVIGYVEQLLVQGELNFNDLRFNFNPLDDNPVFFSAESMSYRRWSKGRQFSFQLETSMTTTQPAELVITLEGETFNARTSALSAWFNFPLVSLNDFHSLWPAYVQEETQNIQGQFSVEGWLSLNEGQTKLDLQARNVEIVRDELWQIAFDEADITLQGQLDNWSADWQIFNLNSKHYIFAKLAGRVGQQQGSSYLQLEELMLDPLTEQLSKDHYLPVVVRELIKDLAPSGHLKNLLVTYNSADEFDLQANLQDIQVNAWEGAPLGGSLNGWLQANAKGGQVIFADHSLKLGFPKLYSPVWNFTDAKGAVRWELDGDDLWVIGENLAVALPVDELPSSNIYVSGDFAYFYGPSDQRFYLNLGLLPVDVAAHTQLVPDRLVEPVLLDWLNSALLAGKVNQAGFIYAGSIKNNAAFQLVTDFSTTDFKFQPDWPSLSQASGQVQVLDSWVKGEVAAAKFGEGQLSNATFSTFPNKKGDIELQVVTEAQAPLEFFPWLVKNSPLQTQVPEPLQEWLYSGQIKSNVNLSIPLSETELEPSVRLLGQISDATLILSQVDLAITEINGPLNFTLDKGLESSGLVGKVMSQPVVAVFNTKPESHLVFSAGLAAKDLKARFKLPDTLNFTGKTQVSGELPLAPFGVLDVTSDFQGLVFSSPLPWNKTAKEKRDFRMQIDFSADELPLRLQLADQLDFLMHLDQPSRGIQLELADEEVAEAVLPEEEGLSARVSVKQLNAEPVYAWYSKFNLNESSEPVTTVPTDKLQGFKKLDVTIDQLDWDDLKFGEFNFTLQNLKEGLKLNFEAAISSGEIWWPTSLEYPLEILISHLYLPEKEAKPKPNKEVSKRANYSTKIDLLAKYNPKHLPTTFIKVDDLRLGKKRFGNVTAQAKPINNGVRFDPFQVDLEQSTLTARLDWLINDSEPTSHIEGKLTGKNIEPALKALTAENEAPIVSGQHQLSFITNWPGSPLGFDIKNVEAELQLDLADGYFPKTDLSLSGISQVVGLLNMDTLLRRLRLNFSDITTKGVSYNTIKGNYYLDKGYLRTTKPTKVVSSATRMTLTGEVDLIEETLEQELIIVLPVAQSLPLAAVLVGAPQVGAAIWVVQKVFSNLFDTFSEARYSINGSIKEPKVELKRVF